MRGYVAVLGNEKCRLNSNCSSWAACATSMIAWRSLSTRILAGATAAVGLALLIAGAYFSIEQRAEIDQVFRKQNQSLVDSLAAFSIEQLVVYDYPALEYAIAVAGRHNDSIQHIEVFHGEQRVASYGSEDVEGERFESEIARSEGSDRKMGRVAIVFSPSGRDALKTAVLHNTLLTMLLIFSAMFISLRWLLRRTVIVPIEQLTVRTEQAIGEALPELAVTEQDVNNGDEIQLLDRRFRSLLSGLQVRDLERDRAECALVEYRDNLEQLVAARTEELCSAREEAERLNRAKSEFLAAASHDLRQPLQAVNLFHTVLKATPLSDEQRAIVQSLSISLNSLGDLLNALLDLSKLDAGRVRPSPEPILAADLLARVDAEFSPLAREKGLRFKLFFPFDDLAILSDPKLLLSMMNNLVGNAIKYTDRGGVLVSVRRRHGRALLQVWDSGIGIDAKDIDKIYDEYFQISNPQRDRTKGLGLGLAIVRRLARLLDTEVNCRSLLGRGSVFSLELPLASPSDTVALPVATDVLAPELVRAHLAGKSVAIVEDDTILRQAMVVAAQSRGLRVQAFACGEELLENEHLGNVEYILSDYRLTGMDGLAMLGQMQSRSLRRLNAVLLTGDTSPERIRTAENSGWPVLFKPVDFDAVLLAWYRNDQRLGLTRDA